MEITLSDLYVLIFSIAAVFAFAHGFNSGYQR